MQELVKILQNASAAMTFVAIMSYQWLQIEKMKCPVSQEILWSHQAKI